MVFRGRRLSPIWHAILRGGAKRIVRLSSGRTKNRIPRSRHFSRRRDATRRQKSEIISRGNSPPDSVHFSWRRGVDGNWLPPWPSPLPSFSLLLLLRFFALLLVARRRFCCPADSSNLWTTPRRCSWLLARTPLCRDFRDESISRKRYEKKHRCWSLFRERRFRPACFVFLLRYGSLRRRI